MVAHLSSVIAVEKDVKDKASRIPCKRGGIPVTPAALLVRFLKDTPFRFWYLLSHLAVVAEQM